MNNLISILTILLTMNVKANLVLKKKTLPLLAEALQIPSTFRCHLSSSSDNFVLILLKHLFHKCPPRTN